jgi:MFS family permease
VSSPRSNSAQKSSSALAEYRALPRTIWVLGLGSLFMDTSSELIHSLLPIFMANVLGASVVTIGVIEGVAEATAAVTKVFSGAISDYFRRRKLFVVLGYGLAALTKPVFAMAPTIWWVFGARFVDRTGKGMRGAPRDALVADIVAPKLRGAAYGLRQALDSVGAFLGPLLAVLFMAWMADNIRAVIWVAVPPAFIAVTLLALAVREPESSTKTRGPRSDLTFSHVGRLPVGYWIVVALGAIFTLARFSDAFLILRARDVGLAIGYVPLIMVVTNVVYAGFAYPAGVAADRLSQRALLVLGLAVLAVSDVVLARSSSPAEAFVGAALWGLHMALTQGLLSKLIADTAPAELRGTAFGIFNLVSGGALLLASVIAGELWSSFGAPAAFLAGALFAAAAAVGLVIVRPGTGVQVTSGGASGASDEAEGPGGGGARDGG